jgi:alcohol dehydrogenase (cytochrome c)
LPYRLIALLAPLAVISAAIAAPPAAESGADGYAHHCAGCHGPTLGGAVGPNVGPTLRGDAFVAKWKAAPPGAFLTYVSKTMPLNQPGGLDAATYAAIGNFVRAENHLPAESIVAAPGQRTVEQQAAAAGELNTVDDATATAARKRLAAIGTGLSPVTEAMLRDPPAGDWLAWRRTQSTLGFSPLAAINRDNVGRLGLAWSLPLGTGSNAIAPLVHDGVLFVHSSNVVEAIDGRSGDVIWSFERPAVTQRVPMNQPRSMALYGRNLYVPTLDNHVLALDAGTGRLVWDHQIGKDDDQIQLTAAPIAVRGKIIQPVAGCQGGVYPGGCFIVALDAASGKEVWRFQTLQPPGQPNDTWNGAPLDKRFGGSVWTTPSYDPETNLIYAGTGQTYIPSTLLNRRPGLTGADDGLYTDSTIALDPDSGRLVWYYQHEPGDVWDLDWSFERSVVTLPTATGPRKAIVTSGKVGIIEALDAKTGQYLWSQDLGLQNFITAIDPKTGRKSYDPAQLPEVGKMKRICPSTLGFRNWPATSYDAATGLMLMPMTITCMDLGLAKGEADSMSPDAFGEFIQKRADVPNIGGNYGRMIAIDLKTRRIVWANQYRAGQSAAAVATAGGVVFQGGRDRWFRALDSATGRQLWQTRLTASPSTFPITYAVDGRQYVAVIAGTGTPLDLFSKGYTPEIPQPQGSKTLMVFALPEAAGR